MHDVLIVEDSRTFASLLTKSIGSSLGLDAVWAPSYAAAHDALTVGGDRFFIALLDLNLPDAPNGEIVDLVISFGLPCIVFTGEMDDDLRDRIWSKKIVDYIYKEGSENVSYILKTIENIDRNAHIGVLVVDDSSTSRNHIASLLQVHKFAVHTAAGGEEALKIIREHEGIRLVITDFNMPDMDGCALTKALRRDYTKDKLSIVGISGQGGTSISARFIKAGANDYLNKPFITEELYCRINQNIEVIEYIKRIRELSEKDFLTGIYNRKYLFDLGSVLYANQQRNIVDLAVAMFDIDDFKKINDAHGHAAGDEVLKGVAHILKSRFRKSDIVSRYGGEEFCVVASNLGRDSAAEIFEQVRTAVADMEVVVDGKCITCTISAGVCMNPMNSLDEMIKQADLMLYEAKRSGKNTVRMFPEIHPS